MDRLLGAVAAVCVVSCSQSTTGPRLSSEAGLGVDGGNVPKFDSGGSGCASACPSGCCTLAGTCVPPITQNWNQCGLSGEACGACDQGVLCANGACDAAHWDPNAMLTLTVTQLYVTAASCNDSVSTPNPYFQIVFDDPIPATIDITGACSTALCEPPSNQIHHIKASWLTDGKTTVSAWDKNAIYSNYECWQGPIALSAPLVRQATYEIPITGYTTPGATFALSAEAPGDQ